jgi:N-acetylmuramic acid 6-phosphate (MurNAc-6-P) etherase
VMYKRKVDADEAAQLIEKAGGNLRAAINA